MKKILLLAPVLFVFAGCAAAPQKPLTITEVKTVVVETPAPLLRPCPISVPPSESDYMAADMQGRENLLSNYTIALLNNLKVCNQQINSISQFQLQQEQLYNKGH